MTSDIHGDAREPRHLTGEVADKVNWVVAGVGPRPGGAEDAEVDRIAPGAPDEPAHDEAKTLIEAFGGVRGMIDTTVPGLVFVLVYTITKNLGAAAWSALGLSAVFGVIRLVRRETVQHAFGGVFGVAIGAVFAMFSGKAENFYLPGMLWTLGLGVLYAVSALAKWPLIGVLLGPVMGEDFTWRTENPGRFKAYTKASWAWAAVLLGKSAIMFPLYFAHKAEVLGWLKVALGIPPFLLAVYITYVFLSKAPPPIKVARDEDDGHDGGAGDAKAEDQDAPSSNGTESSAR